MAHHSLNTFYIWHNNVLHTHLVFFLPHLLNQPFSRGSFLIWLLLCWNSWYHLRTLRRQANQANKLSMMLLRVKQSPGTKLCHGDSELTSGLLAT
uniref:Putative uncharacterized protein encoded by LINC00312 n=1 Tax=Homo sapiens TaxID=9606 RepID=L3R2A_HUMAN